MVQQRTTRLGHQNLVRTHGSSQISRSVAHSEAAQKWDNSGHSHLTCITHVRHVSLKRVTHTFRYSTYAFEKILHMKRDGQSLYLPYYEEERNQVR
jgi:hypothetical protein